MGNKVTFVQVELYSKTNPHRKNLQHKIFAGIASPPAFSLFSGELDTPKYSISEFERVGIPPQPPIEYRSAYRKID